MSGTPGHLEQSSSVPAHLLSKVFGRDCRETQGIKMPGMSNFGAFEDRGAATERAVDADFGGNEEFHSESASQHKNEQYDAGAPANYARASKSPCSGIEDCLEQAAFASTSCTAVCQSYIWLYIEQARVCICFAYLLKYFDL